MRPASGVLAAGVVVFVGLYLLSAYLLPTDSEVMTADQNVFVTSSEGKVVFVQAPDVVQLTPSGFELVTDTAVSEMIRPYLEADTPVRIMAGWRVGDFEKAAFIRLASDPKLWAEYFSNLMRPLRSQRYLGVNLILETTSMTAADQQYTKIFIDNFARNLRLRNLVAMLTVTSESMETAEIMKEAAAVINPDASILENVAISTDGEAFSLKSAEAFFPALARSVDFVCLRDMSSDSCLAVTAAYPFTQYIISERLKVTNSNHYALLSAAPENPQFSLYKQKHSMPAYPSPAKPLTDTERMFAEALNAIEVNGNHLRIGEVLINRTDRQIEFPALLNLSSGALEVLTCDPKKGRVHESLLVSTARPFDLQVGLYLLGLKNGTPETMDSSVRKGDPVDVSVFAHGTTGAVSILDWIAVGEKKEPLTSGEIIFVGSGFKDKRCLADEQGNLIDINSMDGNTILWLTNPQADSSTVYYCRDAVVPRYIGDHFPLPTQNMQSAPVRPEIPKELEIPVTVVIKPKQTVSK